MVYVIATLELSPGKRSAFLAEFAKVMPLVHAEQGCIEYVPTIDADTEIAMQHRGRVQDLVRGKEIRILKTA